MESTRTAGLADGLEGREVDSLDLLLDEDGLLVRDLDGVVEELIGERILPGIELENLAVGERLGDAFGEGVLALLVEESGVVELLEFGLVELAENPGNADAELGVGEVSQQQLFSVRDTAFFKCVQVH